MAKKISVSVTGIRIVSGNDVSVCGNQPDRLYGA